MGGGAVIEYDPLKRGEQKMTDEQQRRSTELKLANRKYAEAAEWRKNSLLQECFAALGEYKILEDRAKTLQIEEIISRSPGKKISHQERTKLQKNRIYYIIWDNASLPVLACKGESILQHWDDAMAVAFDICIVDLESRQSILIRG